MQVGLLAPHALQARTEVIGEQLAPCLAFDALAAPVQLEQHVRIEVWVDLVEVDRNLLDTPERRDGNRRVGARGGADGSVGEIELLDGLLAFRAEGRRRMYYKDPPEDAILYALRFNRKS